MHTRPGSHRQVVALRAALAFSLFAISPPLLSQTAIESVLQTGSVTAVLLIGAVTPTEVSGVAGASFTLGLPEGMHGVYGLRSVERNDKPCFIATMTEDVNNYDDDSSAIKNLCGANVTGNEMKVEFGDVEYAQRTFVRALRVCMDSVNKLVKGFQIRGSEIDGNGNVSDLRAKHSDPSAASDSSSLSGKSALADLNAPIGLRRNCDSWKKWVECPQGRIATAITAHFGPESNPDSLTGIALQCRVVSKAGEMKNFTE